MNATEGNIFKIHGFVVFHPQTPRPAKACVDGELELWV